MATVDHIPTFSTFDPLSSVLKGADNVQHQYGNGPLPVGSRYEVVPHVGPGTAAYVRQPSQKELKRNNGVFASPSRPFYYPDPEGKPFIDVDGHVCGKRWIMVDPRGGEADKGGCVVM